MANLTGLRELVANSISVIDSGSIQNIDDRFVKVGADSGLKGDKGEVGAGVQGEAGDDGVNGDKGEKGIQGLSGGNGAVGVKGQKGEDGSGGSLDTSDQTWIDEGKLNLTQDNLGASGGITA